LSGAPALVLRLRPSRALVAAIAVLHAAAAACVVLVLPGVAGTAIAVLIVALGAAAAWDRALLRGRASPREIEAAHPGEAVLWLADGERIGVATARHAVVNRWWVALPLRSPGRRTLFVAADMLGQDEFRRLRLWALWGRAPGVASGQLPA
jgi:hypothetical protein